MLCTAARSSTPDGPWSIIAEQVKDVVITDMIKFENSQGGESLVFYTDKAVAPDKNCFYRVQGLNVSGVTAWSNVQKLTRP